MKLAEIFPFLVLFPASFLWPACGPTQYALPSNELRYAAAARDDDGMRVTLTPVTAVGWQKTPALNARIEWRQSPLYWGVALRQKENQDLVVPLVPQPSLQVTIENQGREPIRFSDASIEVEDDSGHHYQVATQADQYMPRVLDQLLAKAPDLWFLRYQWGASDVRPEYLGWTAWNAPVLALIEAARSVPLLGRDVVVRPGERWVGALVVLSSTATKELAEQLKGNLKVSWSGVRAGEQAMDPQQFTLPLDGRARSVTCANGAEVSSPDQCPLDGYDGYRADGPCLQLGFRKNWVEGKRVGYLSVEKARWIGGTRVTDSELDEALRDVSASQKLERRARALKAASYTLVLGGVLGAATTAAAIAGAGHEKEAPAGLAVLGVSVVGAVLGYLSVKTQDQAMRAYNREAYQTGVCAAPL